MPASVAGRRQGQEHDPSVPELVSTLPATTTWCPTHYARLEGRLDFLSAEQDQGVAPRVPALPCVPLGLYTSPTNQTELGRAVKNLPPADTMRVSGRVVSTSSPLVR